MVPEPGISHRKYKAYGPRDLDGIPELAVLPPEELYAMKAVSAVLPFRVNNYVIEQLVRWRDVPDDPLFQLTFPQRAMLDRADFDRMYRLVRSGAEIGALESAAREIRRGLNPHPSSQKDLNVPSDGNGGGIPGIQHKYRETVLFFPGQGQTCHAYCTYCFRWAQFVQGSDVKFAARDVRTLTDYLRDHPAVTDVLLTGGDPLIMKAKVLRRYIEPLLAPEFDHVTDIRIGTKATAYWPHRFFADDDADELLRLFDDVVRVGKHLALMSHYSHPRELETPEADLAVRRIRETGAVIRCQAPLIRHVNDSSEAWAELWRRQVELGCVPYYMFVERDTGPRRYFELPLAAGWEIFRRAYREVTGLARTVRGPVMSASPGKVIVDGVTRLRGERVFVLKFLQARNPEIVGIPFFAEYDEAAVWLDDLVPAFDEPDPSMHYRRDDRRGNEGLHTVS